MKNLITYPASQNSPALKSRYNAHIDLEPLQSVIAYLAAQFRRVLELDGDMAKLWKLSRLQTKASRKLETAKVHNFKTGLKWTMLRRPDWRKKVLATLGGDAALTAWERRAATAAAKVPGPYKAPIYKRPPLAALRLGMVELPRVRDPFDVKTDESGAFRLAPIPNPRPQRPLGYAAPELTETQKWERKEGRRLRAELRAKQHPPEPIDESTLKGYWYKDEASSTIYRIAPIPLLPDELRGVGVEEMGDGTASDDANTLVGGPATIPALSRDPGSAPLTHTGRGERVFKLDVGEDAQDNRDAKAPP